MERKKLIYTLGTSTRSVEEFIELLRSHDIEAIIDVRRFPSSRFEHFKQDNIAELLHRAGIDYICMGKELGGYRKGGYQAFATTSEFQKGVKKLEEEAHGRKAAIICAERFPWRCHRRFISLELEKQGWEVRHIIERGRYWTPQKPSTIK